jgi:hypothetical protein
VDWLALHPFDAKWSTWIAQHKLFVSDVCTEDFYTRHHNNNRGTLQYIPTYDQRTNQLCLTGKTTELGAVEFDLTYLKDEIRRQSPEEFDNEENYIEVNIRIRLKIIDRNLDFTAYWPADDPDNAKVIRGSHKLMNVVSAFKPGTD